MIKVFTDTNGKFIKGEIVSALQLQTDKTGPILDLEHKAAKEIKRLTELDFPETDLYISEDGKIERKEEKLKNELLSLEKAENDFYEEAKPLFTQIMGMFDSLIAQKNNSVAQEIIDFSKQYIGTPYRRGTKGPNSFDCSGFTSYVFENFGYKLNRTCVTQINQGTKVAQQELKPGDLVFFKGRNAKLSRAGHVGIVVNNDDFGNVSFIHASIRGVKIDNLKKSPYYQSRYITDRKSVV